MRRALPFLLAAGPAAAADAVVPPQSTLHALGGLALVLAVILGAAWLLKRVQPARFAGSRMLRMVAQLGVGTRERIVVVEIGEQWLVLGVTASSIRTLHTTPRLAGEAPPVPAEKLPFAQWLARARAGREVPGA